MRWGRDARPPRRHRHGPLADVRHVALRDGAADEADRLLVAEQVPHAVRGQDEELGGGVGEDGEDAHLLAVGLVLRGSFE